MRLGPRWATLGPRLGTRSSGHAGPRFYGFRVGIQAPTGRGSSVALAWLQRGSGLAKAAEPRGSSVAPAWL